MAYIASSGTTRDSVTLYLAGLDTQYVGNDRWATFRLYSDPFYQNLVDTAWQIFIADQSTESQTVTFNNLQSGTTYYPDCEVLLHGGLDSVHIYRDVWGNPYSIQTNFDTRIDCSAYSYDYITVFIDGLDPNYNQSGRYAYYAMFNSSDTTNLNNCVEEKWIYDIPAGISSGIDWTFTHGIHPSSTYYLVCYIYSSEGVLLRSLGPTALWTSQVPPLGNPEIIDDTTSSQWNSISVHIDGLSNQYPYYDRTVQFELRRTAYGAAIDTSWLYGLDAYVTDGAYHTFSNTVLNPNLIRAGEIYYVACKIWPGNSAINTESWEVNCWPIQIVVPDVPLGDPYFDYREITHNSITVFINGLDSSYTDSTNDRRIQLELNYYNPDTESWNVVDTIDRVLPGGITTSDDYIFNSVVQPDSDYIITCTIYSDGDLWNDYTFSSRQIHTRGRLQIDCPEIAYNYIKVYLANLDSSYEYPNRTIEWKIYSPIRSVEYSTDYIVIDEEEYGTVVQKTYWLIDSVQDTIAQYATQSNTITFGTYIYGETKYYISCRINSSPYDPSSWYSDVGPTAFTTPSTPFGEPVIVNDSYDYDYITIHMEGLNSTYPNDDRQVYWNLYDANNILLDSAGPFHIGPGVTSGASHTFGNSVIDPDTAYKVELVLQQENDQWGPIIRSINVITPSVPLGDPSINLKTLEYNKIVAFVDGLSSDYLRNDRNIKLELYYYDPELQVWDVADTIESALSSEITKTGDYIFTATVYENSRYIIMGTIWPRDNSWSPQYFATGEFSTPSRLQIDCTAIDYDYFTLRLKNLDTRYRFGGRRVYWEIYSPYHSVEYITDTIEIGSQTYYLIDAAWGNDLNAYASTGGDCTFESYIYGSTSYYAKCTVYSAPGDSEWTATTGPTEIATPPCTVYIDCPAATYYYLQLIANGLNDHYDKDDRTVYWEIRDDPEHAYFDSGSEPLERHATSGGLHTFTSLEPATNYYVTCRILSPDGKWKVEIENVEITTPERPQSNAYIDCFELTYNSVTVFLDNLDSQYSGSDRTVYWTIYKIIEAGQYEYVAGSSGIPVDAYVSSGGYYKFEGLLPLTDYHVSCSVLVGGDSFFIETDYEGNLFNFRTPKGKPPYFEWYPDNEKTSGGRFNLLAAEWNDLEDNINLVRAYHEMLTTWFTRVSTGQTFTANHYNELVYSLRDLPIDRNLTERTSGEDIYAVYLNDLRDAVNSVPRDD